MNPNLFQNLENCLKSNNALATPLDPLYHPGSLVQFTYNYSKPGHDNTPLVLITYPLPYIYRGQEYLRGVNINYLTFPTIKSLLQQFSDRQDFSYKQNLKGNKYILTAFRQYKFSGINFSKLRKLNSPFILNVLACARSVDPNEIEAIRKVIRDQIRGLTNTLAEPTGEMVVGSQA